MSVSITVCPGFIEREDIATSRQLAFASGHLYVTRLSLGDTIDLGGCPSHAFDIAWSHDGSQLFTTDWKEQFVAHEFRGAEPIAKRVVVDLAPLHGEGATVLKIWPGPSELYCRTWARHGGSEVDYEQLWRMSYDGRDVQQIALGVPLAFIHDIVPGCGKALGYVQQEGRDSLCVADLRSGQVEHFVAPLECRGHLARLSPCGRFCLLAITAPDGRHELCRFEFTTGESLILGHAMFASWSPDGTLVAATLNNERLSLIRSDGSGSTDVVTCSDTPHATHQGPMAFAFPSWSPDGRWFACILERRPTPPPGQLGAVNRLFEGAQAYREATTVVVGVSARTVTRMKEVSYNWSWRP
jgi:hypothetical protein